MSSIREYISGLFGKANSPAPLMLPTGSEDYPVALQEEIAGGAHGFDNLAELATMKRSLMHLPMFALINGGDIYVLFNYPPDGVARISDIPNYVITDYWKPLREVMTFPVPDPDDLPKDGDPGLNGWTEIPALVQSGDKIVMQIVDYVGGTGTKPAKGKYVGPLGLVDTVEQATDLLAKLRASITLTSAVYTVGTGGGSAALPIEPFVQGPAVTITNNTNYTRTVFLLGFSMARPDSAQEDTVRIQIQRRLPNTTTWSFLPNALFESRIKDQNLFVVPGSDELAPGQSYLYRTRIQTIGGGTANYAEFSEEPKIFAILI